MASLKIRLMGGIHMEKDGKRLDDKLSLKALAMLCLLLAAEGQQMRKSKIISLLWPESDEEASRNNLRYNLWNIKKILPKEEEELLISDKSTIRINPAYPIAVDTLTLKSFKNTGDYSEMELVELCKLFKGEYLEGFFVKGCMEYSDMILMERIECQNLQIDILTKLYEKCRELQNHSRCVEVLRELLLIDPYNERFACRMMKHMMGTGQYANTMAFYKKFTANMRKDLNIPPSQELKQLYDEIGKGKSVEERTDERSQSSAGLDEKSIQLNVLCIAGIDYFFMTECVRQIAEALGSQLTDSVDHIVLRDISFLHPQVWGEGDKGLEGNGIADMVPCYVPQARLLNAFHSFLSQLTKAMQIDIFIQDRIELDTPSRQFIQLLDHRAVKGLTIFSSK